MFVFHLRRCLCGCECPSPGTVPLKHPQTPCQAGSSGLSGRCWGHNCCPSLAGLCCHSREPRAQGNLSSGCLISFVNCVLSTETPNSSAIAVCEAQGVPPKAPAQLQAISTGISTSSVTVADPKRAWCSVTVAHPAVSLRHIPHEQGCLVYWHLGPLERQVNPQGQAGTRTHFLSHITLFSPVTDD